MPELLKNTAQKSVGTSRHAQEIERKRARVRAFNAEFAAAFAHNRPTLVPDHPVHLLSGALPSVPPVPAKATKATKADPLANASERVKRLTLRHGPEAGKLLDVIERRSAEENGAPINFSTDDAAQVMGVSREYAERVLGALLQAGTLTPRNGPFGNKAGYILSDNG